MDGGRRLGGHRRTEVQCWSAGEWVNGDVDDVPDLLGEAHEEVPIGFVCLHHHLVHDRVRDGLGDDRVLSTNCFCYFAVAHHRVAHCLLTVEEPMACVVRTHDAELSPPSSRIGYSSVCT